LILADATEPKFLLSATWNAPEESFNNPNQPLWKGKSADDALSNIGANYSFVGYTVLPGLLLRCFS